jgi:hypothetical protein
MKPQTSKCYQRGSLSGIKPYAMPQLVVYGTVTDLTAGGSASANENSGAPIFQKRP